MIVVLNVDLLVDVDPREAFFRAEFVRSTVVIQNGPLRGAAEGALRREGSAHRKRPEASRSGRAFFRRDIQHAQEEAPHEMKQNH